MFRILILIPLFLRIFANEEKERNCIKLFKTKMKPRDCCNYPLRFILPSHQEQCKKSCAELNADENSDGCCFLNCNYQKTGVVRNFELDEKSLLELYENYLNNKGAGKFDRWMLTVEESIKACVRLIPKSKKVYTCNIPEFALDIMDCVTLVNFLNCPSYKEDSKECRDLRKFVETPSECGKEFNGTFIIDYKFFDIVE